IKTLVVNKQAEVEAAPAERGEKQRYSLAVQLEGAPVDLHLPSRRGLETNQRIVSTLRLQRRQIAAYRSDRPFVAERGNLVEQYRCRNPVRACRLDACRQIRTILIEL